MLALVAVGGYAIKSTSDKTAKETASSRRRAPPTTTASTYTPEDAGGKAGTDPVEVVIYEDFQCPVCKAFEQANGAFLDEAVKNGDITIEYRLLTFLDRASPNKYSSRAGSAALCAFDAGGGEAYKKVANLLWANQPAEQTAGPEDPALVETLKQAGVSGDAVESCVVTGPVRPVARGGHRGLARRQGQRNADGSHRRQERDRSPTRAFRRSPTCRRPSTPRRRPEAQSAPRA